MNGKVLTENRYQRLVKDIRGLLASGKKRAEQQAQQVLVETYWTIGKRIVEEDLTGTANYGQSIMDDLARDLSTDVRTLQRTVSFFKSYKTAPRGRNLTWSHYRELIGVPEGAERDYYTHKVEEEGWTRDQLLAAIRGQHYLESLGSTKNSRKLLKRPSEATYVYGAVVERVIDGDTLLLRLDLGFAVWKEQRIRLAGVDAPALEETGGREAFEYVREQLAKAQGVVVKTHRIDIYGRFLGHVFYSLDPKMSKADVFAKGRYLNQELLDNKLVKML